ncbi:tryptophan-rich sensory protein [Aquimarina hainanensis]|uniref:Tryptophan-rich sensory protein n=1 Tax=Aquimarina hainanensis TaxID=1578017 RepID=A0ABW5NC78_9FLAO|nr:TspO/MBR family protein [Aquimarina sp. TRL1]QKX07048.1 tryptophan-rich sensory protein [Aquimarina sp. TRL1]
MKYLFFLIIFLIINFAALGIGVYLMNNGPVSEWYISLNKAPWSPPNWLFGVAWSFIMVCFSFYMANLVVVRINKQIIVLFFAQFFLNFFWNFAFFNQHWVMEAFIILLVLTAILGFFLIRYARDVKQFSLLALPYFVWLLLACSLNGYVVFNN